MADVMYASLEANGLATDTTYKDTTSVMLDVDTGGGYAQFTGKTTGGGSLGFKLRAIVAGVLTTLLSFAPGSTAAAFAGNLSAQAVTATSVTAAGNIAVNYNNAFATLTLNPTAGGGSDNAQVVFQRNGVNKWQIGNNVSTGADAYDIYASGSGLALSINYASRSVSVSSGQLLLHAALPAGNSSLEIVGASGAARDLLLVGLSGFSNGMQVQYDGSQMQYTFNNGIVRVGTTVTSGASAGDVVLANGASLRGVSGSGSTALGMLRIDTNNIVQIGQPLAPPAMPMNTSTTFGGTNSAQKGMFFMATDLAGAVVFYDGATGARYKLVGTAF